VNSQPKSWIFELASTVALIFGVIYGAIELRNFRQVREREALTELLHIFETSEYNQAVTLVRALPDSADAATLQATVGDHFYQIGQLANTWETLGYLVHRGDIPLEFVEQSQGGTVRSTWNKLETYAEERRRESGRATTWEWYQWLAEQLDRQYPQAKRVPAYVKYRDWHP